MSAYNNYPVTPQIYTYIWSKYRPAILKLMIASANGSQQYKFSDHEFRRINPKEKGGYTYTLRIFWSKAINSIKGIKASAPAQDLPRILQQSGKASELMEASTYEFILDKYFVLHITRQENALEAILEHTTTDQLIF
jgi:hypothetical protein